MNMNMSMSNRHAKRAICKAILAIYCVSHQPLLRATSIHSEPLATGATSVSPNLMFILDDSGSMSFEYTPDYVDDSLCRDAWEDVRLGTSTYALTTTTGLDSKDDNSALDLCRRGDPTWTSPNFNFQYYNPATTYLPGYNPALSAPAAGTDYNMTNFNTAALWAAVENDPYASNNPSGTLNIINGNTDLVFCNAAAPSTAQLFNTAVCKDPVDTSIVVAAEAAGTGIWRYPNPPYAVSNPISSNAPATLPQSSHYAYRFSRTGGATNPVAPYFYTISQVLFCVNRNGNTNATQPAHRMSASKSRFGKGSTADLTDKCNVRRFNDGTSNFQFPRFGLIPYSGAADTQANNQQEPTPTVNEATNNSANRWAGMSGFRRHQIVETAAGSNTLPVGYPSRSDSTVYALRTDCTASPCTYTQEMTNYANWHAYNGNRMRLMKTSAGKAFRTVDDKFRVGFITINPGSPVLTSRYLALQTFDTGHKGNWFSKFYSQNPSGGTPLREALSRVGRHFGGKTDHINSGMGFAGGAASLNPQGNPDSMIASCQQNFALLTTDGYWTTAGSSYDGAANTGWKREGATAGSTPTRMDDQDHTEPRPYFDGPGVQATAAGTSTGTLADVAMYYYKTDLRPTVLVSGLDIWADNVATTSKDTATHQHMTTFTLGLGLDGILNYQSNYDSTPPPVGDYNDIVAGTKNWPVPTAAGNEEKALDDLWHAAVNGRGKFFSARTPAATSAGLAEALSSISTGIGAGAAAATSNLQPTAGDNWAFTAEYETAARAGGGVTWSGDLKARTIDLVSGVVSAAPLWSASAMLDAKAHATRNIYLFTTDITNFASKLKPFTWTGAGSTYLTDTNLTAAEQALLNSTQLTISNGWDAAQAAAATTRTLVDYLRGDRSKQTLTSPGTLVTDLYQDRAHVLGDIVSAQPIYIKSPPFSYTDNGYAAYKAANAGRRGTVYAAANDGMLHAFESDPDGNPYYQTAGIANPDANLLDNTFTGTNDGGDERWAYIPTRVIPNLYKLAEKNYTHRWFVDASPVVEDYCVTTGTAGSGTVSTAAFTCPGTSSWKAVLVGGLNGGGRGYYALDITDPVNPKGLWEFNARNPAVTACAASVAAAVGASSDCDLGLTYGNPIVTKLPLGHAHSGKWVVLVTSGYNNTPGVDGSTTTTGGDGNGYLYVLDANTGLIIEKIQTCTGFAGTSPGYADAAACGFTKINSYHPLSNEKVDNSPVRVYGGDVNGGMWRVDLTAQVTPRAYLVATLKDTGGTNQPITTPPELYLPTGLDTLSYSNPWEAPAALYIGTGRYYGISDRTDTQRQTLYAIKDIPGTTTTLANARTSLDVRILADQAALIGGSASRSLTGGGTTSFVASNGFYIDFPLNASSLPTGERVNVDSRIAGTTWAVASNIPSTAGSCSAGGSGFVNFIDVNTGAAVAGLTTPYGSVSVGQKLIVGVSVIQIGGKLKAIVTTADNQQLTIDAPLAGTEFSGKRLQWRELTQ